MGYPTFTDLVDSLQRPLTGAETAPPADCEFYRKDGYCRVTGAACPQYQATYKRCEVRLGALATPSQVLLALEEK